MSTQHTAVQPYAERRARGRELRELLLHERFRAVQSFISALQRGDDAEAIRMSRIDDGIAAAYEGLRSAR